MEEIIIFEGDKEKLKQFLAGIGIDIPSDKLDEFFDELQKLVNKTGQGILSKSRGLPQTPFPGGRLYRIIPRTNYSINTKRLAFLTIAIVIDYYFTKGLTCSAISLLGLGQVIYKIKERNGEICIIKTIEELSKRTREYWVQESEIINELLSSSECKYPLYKCHYKTNGKCNISKDDILSILDSLEAKGVIDRRNGSVSIESLIKTIITGVKRRKK